MSSMKTEKLKLHKWNPDDTFDVEEVNENFEKIDNMDNSNMVDFVVEQGKGGANDLWYYRKWNSGRCELWGTSEEVKILRWTKYQDVGLFADIESPTLPFEIYEKMVFVSLMSSSSGLFYATAVSDASNYITFRLTSASLNDIFNGKIKYHVAGRWK